MDKYPGPRYQEAKESVQGSLMGRQIGQVGSSTGSRGEFGSREPMIHYPPVRSSRPQDISQAEGNKLMDSGRLGYDFRVGSKQSESVGSTIPGVPGHWGIFAFRSREDGKRQVSCEISLQ